MLSLKRNGLWLVFFTFALLVMYYHEGEPLFLSESSHWKGKIVLWLMFSAFLGYSIYCSKKENIFKTIKKIYPFYWARQIGLDLYIGLFITLGLIYFNEGSIFVLLIWLIPVILFANLATLLYLAMNYESIVTRFI